MISKNNLTQPQNITASNRVITANICIQKFPLMLEKRKRLDIIYIGDIIPTSSHSMVYWQIYMNNSTWFYIVTFE